VVKIEQIILSGDEWENGTCRVHKSGNTFLMLVKKAIVDKLNIKDKDELKIYVKRVIKTDKDGSELSSEDKRIRGKPKMPWKSEPLEASSAGMADTVPGTVSSSPSSVDVGVLTDAEKDFIEQYSFAGEEEKLRLLDNARDNFGNDRTDQLARLVDG